MRPSQIIAIDAVEMEARPEARERLIWFYGEVVGLLFVEDPSDPDLLRFGSHRLELRVRLRDRPRSDEVRRRALVSVRSLDDTAGVLEKEGIALQRLSGLTWTDRRISLVDPGGNRVELKQEWRRGVFPTDAEQARARRLRLEGRDKKPEMSGDKQEPSGYSTERSESGRS